MLTKEQVKLALHMIAELESVEGKLSSWERGFVADMGDRLADERGMSLGQLDKLREIYGERTA